MEIKQIVLPCLRCGLPRVAFFAPQSMMDWNSCEIPCERCGGLHYLALTMSSGQCLIVYDRFTMRYPMEQYDDDTFPRIELRRAHLHNASDDSDDSLFGPIVVYKRKKHFSRAEKATIWHNSHQRCHLCGKGWRLKEQSRNGWHIDHVIPNVGGGKDTESFDNFRVACARCNLKKGRGYTERTIRQALNQLFL